MCDKTKKSHLGPGVLFFDFATQKSGFLKLLQVEFELAIGSSSRKVKSVIRALPVHDANFNPLLFYHDAERFPFANKGQTEGLGLSPDWMFKKRVRRSEEVVLSFKYLNKEEVCCGLVGSCKVRNADCRSYRAGYMQQTS